MEVQKWIANSKYSTRRYRENVKEEMKVEIKSVQATKRRSTGPKY